jgi:hypothetical protein
MNVKLRKVFDFATGIVYNSEFHVNHYTASVSMTTVSDDPDEHNIAYERMKWWIDFVLGDSIIINENDPLLAQWMATEQRILVLPDQPVDQLVGIMMYLKLTAIVEGRINIDRIDVESTVGDNIEYIHYATENLGPLSIDGWWKDAGPTWAGTKKKRSRNNNVIKLDRSKEWAELDLSFDKDTDPTDKDTVVFIDFVKNEEK